MSITEFIFKFFDVLAKGADNIKKFLFLKVNFQFFNPIQKLIFKIFRIPADALNVASNSFYMYEIIGVAIIVILFIIIIAKILDAIPIL